MTEGRILTGVSGTFCANHRDRETGEIHPHTWEVMAWFEHRHQVDARCDKAMLDNVLSAWDRKILPDELAWGEDIARAIGTLVSCVEVIVSRPRDGLHARWIATAA